MITFQTDTNTHVKETYEGDGLTVEILQFQPILGNNHLRYSTYLHQAQENGVRLKQIHIDLHGGSIVTEQGTLQSYQGQIKSHNRIGGVTGGVKRLFQQGVTEKSFFRPVYSGYGHVYLEPSFKHFQVIELHDETVVLHQAKFYACSEGVELGTQYIRSLTNKAMRNSGWFLTVLKGTGIAVVELAAPEHECRIVELEHGETMSADDDTVALRKGIAKHAVRNPNSSLIRSLFTKQRLFDVFEGPGTVWLTPAAAAYKDIRDTDLIQDLVAPKQAKKRKKKAQAKVFEEETTNIQWDSNRCCTDN